MTLAKMIYKLTQQFPVEERYGLVSQLRRASVSAPSNIAEGQARQSHEEGSLAEMETLLSIELGFCNGKDTEVPMRVIDELQKMMVSLKRKLASYSPLATRHSPLSSRCAERH